MISRTILKTIENSIKSSPVTLITGARQVGKTTLSLLFKDKSFSYVSLDDMVERELASKDPKMFLEIHPFPLIIDEIQKAPILFEALEEKVNKEKINNNSNYGMYIITGSEIYKLMNKVSESMAGRVSIVHVLPLSRNEIISRSEEVFDYDITKIAQRALNNPLSINDLFNDIIKGYYPELYSNEFLLRDRFYSNYIETYIEKDVCELINIKDKYVFRKFMEILASLTGEELNIDNISKVVGVSNKTINSWISILLAGDIIYLLEPYNEYSIVKRVVKRPKIYFNDTGLASYLVKINNGEILKSSFLCGRFIETYIINALRKRYINNGIEPPFYYYRDSNKNEIDLVIVDNGYIHRIECKMGINFNMSHVKGFKQLNSSNFKKGIKVIISNTSNVYPLDDDTYVIPLAGI